MAGTPAAAEGLLAEVWEPAKRVAATERDRLLAVARAEGFNGALAPWDWRYYAEKVRRADYAVDETEIKPYFVLENIQSAAFDTANAPVRCHLHAAPRCPNLSPPMCMSMRCATRRAMSACSSRITMRVPTSSGAWMSSYRDQETLDGEISPINVNNNNFAKSEPTLLSFDDAETLFHEFGHALHGLLSRVRYPDQSGTSVRRDFVELPSQIYEHWIALPETLGRFALHHETGAPVPPELVAKLLAARDFNQGFGTVEYTAAALIDMAMHSHPAPKRSTSKPSKPSFSRASACPRKSASVTGRRISSTCSRAVATRRATTPTSGRKCSMPTGSRHSRRREALSILPPQPVCASC